MRNFIKITEVDFNNNDHKPKFFNDFIRPSEIILLEQMTVEGLQVTKINFPIGGQKFSVYVKETPEEIDTLIDGMYEGKKRKPKTPTQRGR